MVAKQVSPPMELDSPQADLRFISQESDFFQSLGEEVNNGAIPVGVYLLYEALYEKVLRDFKDADTAWSHFKNVLTLMQWLKPDDLNGLGFFCINPQKQIYKKMCVHFETQAKEQQALQKKEAKQKEGRRGRR